MSCPQRTHSGCVPDDILVGVNQAPNPSSGGETIVEVVISGFDEGAHYQMALRDEVLQENVLSPQDTHFVLPYAMFQLHAQLINGRQYSIQVYAVNPDPVLVTSKYFYANYFNPIPPTCGTGSHLGCVPDSPPALLDLVTTTMNSLFTAGVINEHHKDAFITMFSKLIELAH